MQDGGYTDPRPLTLHDWEVFSEATKYLFGVHYRPFNVATQVVCGTNYRFFCEGKVYHGDEAPYRIMAEIYVHEELPCYGGKISIMNIIEVNRVGLAKNEIIAAEEVALKPGGYSDPRPLEADDLEVFKKALNGYVGARFTPLNVATQVVCGTNYRFFCEGKVLVSQGEPYRIMVEIYVHKDLPCYGGKVSLISIVEVDGSKFPAEASKASDATYGGYTQPRELEAYDQKVFDKAFKGFTGACYKPLTVATAVVNGTMYLFDCEMTIVNQVASSAKAFVFIHKELPCYGGRVTLVDIKVPIVPIEIPCDCAE